MLSIFLCGCWSSVCLLWRNVYSDPLSPFNCLTLLLVFLFVWFLFFFFLMMSCMHSLYIFYINSLLDRLFTNILSHWADCLFIWLTSFLHFLVCLQKKKKLAKTFWFGIIPLLYFCFWFPCLWVLVIHSCLTLWSHGLLCLWNSPDKITGVDCHSFTCGDIQKNIANTDVKKYTAYVFF